MDRDFARTIRAADRTALLLTSHRHAHEIQLHAFEQGRYRVRLLHDDVLNGVLHVRDRARYLPSVEVQPEEDPQSAVLESVYGRSLVGRTEYASPKQKLELERITKGSVLVWDLSTSLSFYLSPVFVRFARERCAFFCFYLRYF